LKLLSYKNTLPTGFNNPWNFTVQSHISKADTADTEFSQKGPRSAADRAPIITASGKFLLSLSLSDKGFFCQNYLLVIV